MWGRNMHVRNIDQLSIACAPARDQSQSLVCALAGNRTRNLLVFGMMLQTTKPPGQRGLNYNLRENF